MSLLTERTWPSVLITPISITGNVITVPDTCNLKVKQKVILSKTGLDPGEFEIKRVMSRTTLMVGPVGKNIRKVSEAEQYNGGSLSVSEQSRNVLGDAPIIRAVYDEEPTLALRNIMVDKYGDYFNKDNPFPVTVVAAPTYFTTTKNVFGEQTSVASSSSVNIVSYTVPAGKTANLLLAEFSGNNIATYEVLLNSVVIARKRTWFNGPMHGEFLFLIGNDGTDLSAGDNLIIKVYNFRPTVGTFEGRLLISESL